MASFTAPTRIIPLAETSTIEIRDPKTLRLTDTNRAAIKAAIKAAITGQGIAFEGNQLFGIDRAKKQVVVLDFKTGK